MRVFTKRVCQIIVIACPWAILSCAPQQPGSSTNTLDSFVVSGPSITLSFPNDPLMAKLPQLTEGGISNNDATNYSFSNSISSYPVVSCCVPTYSSTNSFVVDGVTYRCPLASTSPYYSNCQSPAINNATDCQAANIGAIYPLPIFTQNGYWSGGLVGGFCYNLSSLFCPTEAENPTQYDNQSLLGVSCVTLTAPVGTWAPDTQVPCLSVTNPLSNSPKYSWTYTNYNYGGGCMMTPE